MLLGITIVLCAGCISLASSAGNCTHLDANLFGRCISIGIDRSLANDADEVAGLLNKTVAKFRPCSRALVDIMACSIYVPKCREGRSELMLPCPEVCNKFVSDCALQDGVDVVRKLCLLLPADNKNASCLKPEGFKNNSTVAEPSSQTCKPLSVQQCHGLGYNLTTLSTDSQLRLRESDIMKKIENASILVKRLACTELAPPCFQTDKDKLLTACKGRCIEASQNHSKQFIDIFGTDPEYCTGQPEKAANSRGQFCPRHTWPKSGLWSEGLRWTLAQESSNGDINTSPTNVTAGVTVTAAPSPTNIVNMPQNNASTTDNSTSNPNSTTTAEPPMTPSNLTMAPPTTKASNASLGNTTAVPITKPSDSTTTAATTAMAGNSTSPLPTTNAASESPSTTPVANVTTTAPISKSSDSTTTAATTAMAGNSTSPSPTTNAASESPSTTPVANVTTTAPISKSSDSTTPAATTAMAGNSTSPPPTTNAASESPSTAPVANVSTTAPISKSSDSTTPAATTAMVSNSTSPPPTTNARKSSSKERSTERGASTKSVTNTRFTTTRPTSNGGKGDVHARKKPQKKTMSGGAIAGAAIGTICGLILIIALAVFLIRRRRNSIQYAHRVMVDMDDL